MTHAEAKAIIEREFPGGVSPAGNPLAVSDPDPKNPSVICVVVSGHPVRRDLAGLSPHEFYAFVNLFRHV